MSSDRHPPIDYVLWHNPDCSKSRAALDLLRGRGVQPRLRDYLAEPPSLAAIAELAAALGEPVKTMMRTHEPEYAQLHLDEPGVSDAALCAAMASHPHLIQRPILQAGGRAVVGRPPERVLELLPEQNV